MWQNFTAVGRLTKDVERKVTATNKYVSDFSIAVNSGKDIVDYIDIQVWEKTAEYLSKNGRKGMIVFVTGTLKSNSYKNKDGQTINRKYILANRVELVGGKAETSENQFGETDTEAPTDSAFGKVEEEKDPFAPTGESLAKPSDLPF